MDADVLQHDAALMMLYNDQYQTMSDFALIQMLCGILGLPLPGESGSVGDSVADLKTVYEQMRNEGNRPGDLVRWVIRMGNTRLVFYYLEQVTDVDYLGYLVGIAFERFSITDPDVIVELVRRYNVYPGIRSFVDLYGTGHLSRSYVLWYLTKLVPERRGYDESVYDLGRVTNEMIKNDDVEAFVLLIDKLFNLPGYREGIQRSLDTTLVSPFFRRGRSSTAFIRREKIVVTEPIPSSFIRVLRDRGFKLLDRDRRHLVDLETTSGILRKYTGDDEIWDSLVRDMGVKPDRSDLVDFIKKGDLERVTYLIENGVETYYDDVYWALGRGHYEMADYLFSVSWGRRIEILRSGDVYPLWDIGTLQIMRYVVGVYWKPSDEEIRAALQAIYMKGTPEFIGPQKSSIINLFINSLRADLREELLREYFGVGSLYSMWLTEALLRNRDEV